MSKNSSPPPYGPPPAAPPSYAQAVGGVPPTSPYVPNHSCKCLTIECWTVLSYNFVGVVHRGPEILTTVVPVGPEPTHMICPHCHAEIDTTTKTEPGLIAYIVGTIICLIG